MNKRPHIPVLLNEVIQSLHIKKGGIYVDGTFGAGGYTQAILDAEPTVRVIAIDRDETAIAAGQDLVKKYAPRLTLLNGQFGDMEKLVSEQVDGVVLDIGVSSMQIDRPERGFSFQKDGPLDMRMGQSGQTAADIVNSFDEEQLADIIYQYGEERFSRKIAKAITQARQIKPFETTMELANVIHKVMPHKAGDIDSATRTFQALRIFVNDELGELERGLKGAEKILKNDGILSVVTFHSLEDRIVKNFLQNATAPNQHINKYKPTTEQQNTPFKLAFKKPLSASEDEIKKNPRSRSAHLRSAIRQRQVK
ncbi:MAG: 16S rRNA (cytosine(1402)-N(4))-methyltransferase RsmH [Alphaproteobacteria bacterium]|nr:16S rRNA (cytosine(1402)-N(4))-methyltransferase RsmH [Alphaproteobacteria bacterium]